jgi:PAS domain S-box-containing protein
MSDPSESFCARTVGELSIDNECFSLLVQAVCDYAIVMVSPDGTVMSWNEGATKILGYSAPEIVGRHFSCLYTDEGIEEKLPQRELETTVASGRYEKEGWRVRKDGTQIWTNVVITPIKEPETGKNIGFANVTRDLTERKLASQSEQVFRLLVNSVRDYAIFMLDPAGYVLTWNEGAQQIQGYTADEIIGKHFSTFYEQEAVDRKHPQSELEMAQEHGRYEEQGWRLRKDGSRFWASVVINAVHDHNQ